MLFPPRQRSETIKKKYEFSTAWVLLPLYLLERNSLIKTEFVVLRFELFFRPGFLAAPVLCDSDRCLLYNFGTFDLFIEDDRFIQ
jgi:hypothetical protein